MYCINRLGKALQERESCGTGDRSHCLAAGGLLEGYASTHLAIYTLSTKIFMASLRSSTPKLFNHIDCGSVVASHSLWGDQQYPRKQERIKGERY
jgi:hypothetical protein